MRDNAASPQHLDAELSEAEYALMVAYWWPDRLEEVVSGLPDLPEIAQNDSRLVEVQDALAEFLAQSDTAAIYQAFTRWGNAKGWPIADLLALLRHLGRLRRHSRLEEWRDEIGGSKHFLWPGHPIMRTGDGQLIPRGLTSIPRAVLFDHELSDTAVRIYGILMTYAIPATNGTWRATVPIPRLLQHFSFTEPTLRAHMARLEARGYVEDIGQQHGGNRPNTYVLRPAH